MKQQIIKQALLFALSISSMSVIFSLLAADEQCTASSCTVTSISDPIRTVKLITPAELKRVIDTDPTVTIVDARTYRWDTKERIGNALSIPCDSTEDIITKMLPSKSQQIIVYCGGGTCPAGEILGEKLVKLGYYNVSEMKEGIEGWKKMGYPVQKSQ